MTETKKTLDLEMRKNLSHGMDKQCYDTAEQLIRQAWHEFVEKGKVQEGIVRPLILKSWLECRKIGLSPFQKKAPYVLSKEELESRKSQCSIFLEVAVPIAMNLYNFVAGSGFIIAIADSEGYLLEIMGDEDVKENVKQGNFIEGANWSEEFAGTNGVGSCLKYNLPLQICGYEHYCICSHNWTCSGAPIHDSNGKVIGALDMTAIREKVHSHTLGMIVGAAYAIERQLALMEAWRKVKVADQYKNAIIDAVSDALIATDSEYKITHFNERAQEMLGINKSEALGVEISKVLGLNNKELMKVLEGKKYVTDHQFNIYTRTGKLHCSLTSRPIVSNGCLEGLVLVIEKAKRVHRLANKIYGAKASITFADILGNDPRFIEMIEMAKVAARSSSNVLILGETGTGKDMLAQAIHNASSRRDGPFIAINCGAIPRELIASELFGYEEGAFTGARKGGNPGKFELADGGTIFLDEIGEMPLELQTALLRVLEQKAITRVGGTDLIPVNVRIIAATNKNLLAEIEKGNFRRDLFYRLNVIAIRTIPLRERKTDIKPLALHFMRKVADQIGKKIETVDEEIWERFITYNWPGNVRELYNAVERIVNIASNNYLGVDLLPEEIKEYGQKDQIKVNGKKFGREELTTLIKMYNGNISKVAKELGIARTTVYRMMWKYNIQRSSVFGK